LILALIFLSTSKERAYTLIEYVKLILDFPDDENNDYDWSNSLDYFYAKNV
jgi:hypothetical protein